MKLRGISGQELKGVEVAVAGAVAAEILGGAAEPIEHVAGLHRRR